MGVFNMSQTSPDYRVDLFDTSYYTPPRTTTRETVLTNGSKTELRDSPLSETFTLNPRFSVDRKLELQTYKRRDVSMITMSAGIGADFRCVAMCLSDIDLLELKLQIERYFDAQRG